jgi:flagellar biosynthesis/type III secretory pathway chaperone
MDTDFLAQLIDRKHEVLEQLHQLAQRQLAVAGEGGQTSELLGVLAAKQGLLDQLQSLQRQLDPYRHQDPDSRRWRSPRDRQRCAQVSGRCQSLLGEVIELERRSEVQLKVQRDKTAAQLRAVSTAAEARAAYTSGPSVAHPRLDVASEA